MDLDDMVSSQQICVDKCSISERYDPPSPCLLCFLQTDHGISCINTTILVIGALIHLTSFSFIVHPSYRSIIGLFDIKSRYRPYHYHHASFKTSNKRDAPKYPCLCRKRNSLIPKVISYVALILKYYRPSLLLWSFFGLRHQGPRAFYFLTGFEATLTWLPQPHYLHLVAMPPHGKVICLIISHECETFKLLLKAPVSTFITVKNGPCSLPHVLASDLVIFEAKHNYIICLSL